MLIKEKAIINIFLVYETQEMANKQPNDKIIQRHHRWQHMAVFNNTQVSIWYINRHEFTRIWNTIEKQTKICHQHPILKIEKATSRYAIRQRQTKFLKGTVVYPCRCPLLTFTKIFSWNYSNFNHTLRINHHKHILLLKNVSDDTASHLTWPTWLK